MAEPHFTLDQARAYGTQVGIDWETCGFTDSQFQSGMCVERERSIRFPDTSSSSPVEIAEKVHANLFEFPDYYTEQDMLEAAYDEYWSERRG